MLDAAVGVLCLISLSVGLFSWFPDVLIDSFECENCIFPVMRNCSWKPEFFHTHTHSPWCSRSMPIVCDHNRTCFRNFQHPQLKTQKGLWFTDSRYSECSPSGGCTVRSVEGYLCAQHGKNVSLSKSKKIQPFIKLNPQSLHAISHSTNHRDNVTWPYFLPAMSWLLVGGLLEWSLPIRPRLCETRWTQIFWNLVYIVYIYIVIIISCCFM